MLTDQNYDDLKVKGYTVVSDVLTGAECDQAIGQYREWLSQFKDDEWPYSTNSLIQRYNSGNMEPSWSVRLKTKRVFAQVWKTDKLLSSIDAIAIGRPPEESEEEFSQMCDHWLHLDQSPSRDGLHAYQGGVYLEEACEDDWTLEVMEGSHLIFKELFETSAKASMKAEINQFYSLTDEEVITMRKKGCAIKRIPAPKGGMVLWDSRLVHANARPMKRRQHPGRWRFCVFVSMTPAIWATKDDLDQKREAYKNASMTTHWSSQGVNFFKTSNIPSFAPKDTIYPKELPEIAKSKEAKQLCGVIPYDFNDGKPTGEELKPKWNKRAFSKDDNFVLDKKKLTVAVVSLAVVATGVFIAIYKIRN